VEYDEASAYAEENSLLFMETSAKERTKPALILQQKPPVAHKKYLQFSEKSLAKICRSALKKLK
jgi:hypothetical protein